MKKIVVGIGEGKIAFNDDALISYALGSCIGVCLYDAYHHIGAMAHIVLPHHPIDKPFQDKYKYADLGVHFLINEMIKAGANRRHIVAKIAGGAEMFTSIQPQWQIGKQNIQTVCDILKREKIQIIAEDVGENYGRTITFYALDGRLEIHSLRKDRVI